jgi:hypothetical protein
MKAWDTLKELWTAPSTGHAQFAIIAVIVFGGVLLIEANWPWLLHWSN